MIVDLHLCRYNGYVNIFLRCRGSPTILHWTCSTSITTMNHGFLLLALHLGAFTSIDDSVVAYRLIGIFPNKKNTNLLQAFPEDSYTDHLYPSLASASCLDESFLHCSVRS